MKRILLPFIFVFFSSNVFSQQAGIDLGQPINPATGEINAGVDSAIAGKTCTPWVRINFILGPWSSPTDTTLYNGKTWEQTYSEIIDKLTAKGIQVYGLIGGEAVYTPLNGLLETYPGTDSLASEAWIQEYVNDFVSIVGFYKNNVRVFESFNEPNNWTYSSTAVIHPEWFAYILQRLYLEVKFFGGHSSDPSWQVTMVSGALFTFDLNSGGSYISDTYWYGKNIFAWNWVHANTGSYPLDGFGMHLYVAQGTSDPTTITNALSTNITDFRNNIYLYEDDPGKKIWVSEFGWESAAYGEVFQKDNLNTSFNFLLADSRIAVALWFTQSDWPGASWGLYNFGGFNVSDRKLAYYAFRDLNGCTVSPSNPHIASIPSCSDVDYNVTFDWEEAGEGWWLDISTDPGFSTIYNKDISYQTSVTAPAGFCDWPSCLSSLTLSPGTTYYWRMFNGSVHTAVESFSVPPCITTSIKENNNTDKPVCFFNAEQESIIFNCELSESQQIDILLYDVTGNKIQEFVVGDQPTGIHQFLLPLSSDLPAGIYFIDTRLNKKEFHKKLAIF